MERLQRAAVVFSLIDALSAAGSWCGETHIQKATYFLEELCDVQLGYNFILYKYGPYSFDFHEDLQAWRGDNLLRVEVRNEYGPSILPNAPGERVKELYPKTLRTYEAQIEAVAKRLGSLGVSHLERLATALYVTRQVGISSKVAARADRLIELKPHVSKDDAVCAVHEVDAFISDTQPLLGVRG
jgi:uncharacterized protein YwgA